MNVKKEDLELSIKRYQDYLKGRKKPNNGSHFEAGFDFGYNAGLIAAWNIIQENRDLIISEEDKREGIFRKYHASSVVHKLLNMIGDLSNSEECNCYKIYKNIESFCTHCGKSK